MTAKTRTAAKKETFGSRNAFILAAIGSAVGLGNIWRFPYVAYENGGGAFIIPYLVALLCAGIPLLFLDYVIGQRYGGSSPLSLARIQRWMESLGWWQVLVCVIIGIYYAVIVAWSAMFLIFSFTKSWGDDANAFFFGDFLQLSDTVAVGFDFVPNVFWPQLLVWVGVLVVMLLGVRKGIAGANFIFMPLLVVMFLAMVVVSLFLPGSLDGLNAFFTPDWGALLVPSVWAAAVGQIFFSLSVGFGIMITYASYLRKKTDLTGSGLVVAFSNSSFEILAGIGVFAALGFMANAAGTGINDVVDAGIGLAFVAFPTIISQAPLGEVIGVLFFGSLLFAGFTSMISIIEVVIAGVRDKLGIKRWVAVTVVVVPMAIISLLLFPTSSGLYVLDVLDAFVNQFGILAGALVMVIAVSWIARKLPMFSRHLTRLSSFPARKIWMVLIGGIVPLALIGMLASELIAKTQEVYGGYPPEFVLLYGWGMSGLLIVGAILLSLLPWTARVQPVFDDAKYDREIDGILAGDLTETEDGSVEIISASNAKEQNR
ncbi:sodium-dependent transporter [Gulosibacter chungangensis]|uniref:Transporter n=1 Tax=Gulosibacter chungangensis TaxID=979746 RepID=A0A7J5BE08_9MICO|nr:sodium-dependent transporter [Gulosibacter chungangensis]KAB1643518.1 sodium-dependent transporter [Gulosibacter chungangensis]